jgi:lipopolysaccharide heptosyltransferase I
VKKNGGDMSRILVIKMSALGDVVLALPHIHAIAAHHRKDDLHLITGTGAAGLFAVSETFHLTRINPNRRLGANGRWAVGRWVRRQGFDRVYDLQGNSASKTLVRASRAPLRVGTQPDPVYNRCAPGKWRRTIAQNAFDRLNDTLASAGVPGAAPATGMAIGEAEIGPVEAWMAEKRLTPREFVVMHAGCNSRWRSKRWPAAHFVRLSKMIENCGLNTVWVGAREDADLNRAIASQAGIDATGVFSLRQTFALATKARFAVSNDSCPMHLFALTGIPVYSFFGPTNWQWSHPTGQGQRVLRAGVDCSPCFKPVCPPEKEHACMEGITPEGVFERIERGTGLGPVAGGQGDSL